MNYEKINMGSYNLHIINTNKFKTTSISINFRRPVVKEEITIRKFLFSMLCDSTKKFPTRRLMEIEQENLYLLNLAFGTQIIGKYINSFVDIKVLNESFSETGMLDKSLDFLFDVLFDPNVENKTFDNTTFEVIKNKMETGIKSIKDSTDMHSIIKVLEEMDNNNPTSFHTWGYLDDLYQINNCNLYNYYLDILKSDIIDIFIVGEVDVEEIKKKFKESFRINTLKGKKTDIFITYNTYRKRIKKVLIEEELLQQSRLSVACKILNITDFERKYVFPLYAHILGGNAYSRLFQNVREKNSLAYNISAFTKSPCSIMIISSGIERTAFDKTLRIIKREIKNMTVDITEDELNNSKNDIITTIDSIVDNSMDIITYHYGMEVLNSDNIEKKKANILSVTKNDIINFGNKVKMDTVVLLYGRENNEENTN